MSKLGTVLGDKYQQNRISILTRTFEMGGHTFKVRVPSVNEIDAIFNYFKNPDMEKVEEVYQELTKDLKAFESEKSDNVEFKNDDIIIDGRSMREAAKNKVVFEYRIVEYVKLLIPEDGQTMDGLEYKDVEEEFPLSVQIKLVENIAKAISPDYEEIKGK